jgi:hypothetical protein
VRTILEGTAGNAAAEGLLAGKRSGMFLAHMFCNF